MTFGTKLQKLRREKSISQKEISNILEVSQTIYGKWESDIFYPTYKNLKKIAIFYMIDVESLTENNLPVNIVNSSNSKINSLKVMSELSTNIEKLVVLVQKQIEILEKHIKD